MNDYLVILRTGDAARVSYRVTARNRQHAVLVAGWELKTYGNITDPELVEIIEARLMRRG